MPDSRARITWLHVSDLHVTKDALGRTAARRPGSELWADVQRTFFADLDAQLEATGLRPDLVLITGDLVYSGSAKQYANFDAELLGPLLAHLRARGCEAVPFAVPGNHDLERPSGPAKLAYRCLREYDIADDHDDDLRYLRAQLWSERNAAFLDPLFTHYSSWAERSMLPGLVERTLPSGLRLEALHRSHVPGDLSVVVAREGLRLLLVGLNSSWIQFDGRDFKGKLHVPIEQLHAALAAEEHAALRRFDQADAALLLMHHPRDWLSPAAARTFDGYVYPARDERFTACLFGHMHEARSEMSAGNGSAMRYFYQSPSLFGLEHYGETRARLDVGYTLGALYEDQEIRLWVRRMGASGRFDVDPELHREPDGALRLRPPRSERVPPTVTGNHTATGTVTGTATAEPHARPSDSAALGAWLLARYDKLELLAPTGTFPYPFDEVYIPLAIAMQEAWRAQLDGESPDGDLGHDGGSDIALAEIFARAREDREVMIFGHPGGGKTTTLAKICHQVLLEGGETIGLPRETLPILLPLRHLTHEDLAQADALLCLARRETSRGSDPLAPGVLERLWAQGGLLLLLDGLDEITDVELRNALVQHVVHRAGAHRRQRIRHIVSSRFSGVTRSIRAVLDQSFLRLDVRPLERDRIEALVHRWFRAAKHWQAAPRTTEERARAETEAHDHAARVLADLRRIEREDFEFKNLVATPLLLTLLCAVALANGEIPHKRPEFYQRCLEVLLRRYILKTGLPAPVPEPEALRMLQEVAHGLHEERRRDGLSAETFVKWTSRRRDRIARGGLPLTAATALLHWLHQHAGVLTKFGDDDYGFAHLTFQEYLTAQHIAYGGDEPVQALADRFGDPWWQEVTLLCLALPPRRTFAVLMHRVLDGERWLADAVASDEDTPEAQRESRLPMQLLRECWEDADERTVEPFLRVLRRPPSGGWIGWVRGLLGRPVSTEAIDRQRIEVMKLLLGETHAELVALAQQLRDDARESEPVRAIAGELVVRAQRGAQRRELVARARAPRARPGATEAAALELEEVKAEPDEARLDDLALADQSEADYEDDYDADASTTDDSRPSPRGKQVERAVPGRDAMPVESSRNLPVPAPVLEPVPMKAKPATVAMPKPVTGAAPMGAAPAPPLPRSSLLGAGAVDPRKRVISIHDRQPTNELLRGPAPALEAALADAPTRASASADLDPAWIEPIAGLRLLWVPGGSFMMGAAADDPDARDNEQPQRLVTLDGFWLAETPVTNAQYGEYLRATELDTDPRYWRHRRFSGKDQPVVGIGWHEARAFCEWLSRDSGSSHYLPSEAQWEYAARGPDHRRYPWGDEAPDPTRACFGRLFSQPAPVGQHPRGKGPFEHLDLAGNVWEWCHDANGHLTRHSCRGGGWASRAQFLRSTFRKTAAAKDGANTLGFRVCCTR